jgi:hypothetical protein
MTIADGQLITAADLNAMTTAALALIQADNAQLPGAVQPSWQSFGIVAGTSPAARTWVFVAPVDLIVENVVVQACDHTAASTTTVTLTPDGPAAAFPIAVTGTTGAGRTVLRSPVFDGTPTNVGKDFSTTSRVVRVWPKGTTVTVVVSTTSVAAASAINIAVVARAFYSRGLA